MHVRLDHSPPWLTPPRSPSVRPPRRRPDTAGIRAALVIRMRSRRIRLTAEPGAASSTLWGTPGSELDWPTLSALSRRQSSARADDRVNASPRLAKGGSASIPRPQHRHHAAHQRVFPRRAATFEVDDLPLRGRITKNMPKHVTFPDAARHQGNAVRSGRVARHRPHEPWAGCGQINPPRHSPAM